MPPRPLLLALSLGLALSACGEEPAAAAYAPGSAREALHEYNGAVRALDEARARSWVLDGAEQDEFFAKSFAVAGTIQRFETAVREAFGAAGLERVLTSPGGQRLELAAGLSPDELARSSVQQQGELAVAQFPGGGAMRLVRRGGVWRVDLVGDATPAEVEAARQELDFQLTIFAQTLERARTKLARGGETLESFESYFDRELETALSAAPR